MTGIDTPRSVRTETLEVDSQARQRAAQTRLAGWLRTLLSRRRLNPGLVIETLMAENGYGTACHDSHEPTPCESMILDRCSAQARIQRGSRRLRRWVWWHDRTATGLLMARFRHLQLRTRPLRGLSGELYDPAELASEIATAAHAIQVDESAGASGHRRTRWWLRLLPWFIAVFDFTLLWHFMTGVLNVAPQQQFSAQGLSSLFFALLGGVVMLGWLTLVGERLRALREASGRFAWHRADGSTWLMVCTGLLVAAALGLLMFLRIHHEVTDAFSSSSPGLSIPLITQPLMATALQSTAPSATPIAAVFAILSVAGNLAVIAVHAVDGTPQQQRIEALCRVARRRRRALERCELKIERRRIRLMRQRQAGRRLSAITLAQARAQLVDAAGLLNSGRAATGRPVLPVPRTETGLVDISELSTMAAGFADGEISPEP